MYFTRLQLLEPFPLHRAVPFHRTRYSCITIQFIAEKVYSLGLSYRILQSIDEWKQLMIWGRMEECNTTAFLSLLMTMTLLAATG